MRPSLVGAAIAVLSGLAGVVALRGFTVDDALIPARVAHHLASGSGYRFNPGGDVVDAVTPLGFAHLLVPFAATPERAWWAARVLGASAWLAACAPLGAAVARLDGARLRYAPLALLALAPSFGAWAVAGLATGLVTALATVAVVSDRARPWCAGLAAAWRPELVPWALALALGDALRLRPRHGLWWRLPATLGPALIVAAVRQVVFDHPAPLAAIAKPSDAAHGLRYALGALAFTGPPLAALVAARWQRLSARARVIGAAAVVHGVALLLAGGDAMPMFRLATPVLPGLVLLASSGLATAGRLRACSSLALGLAGPALMWWGLGGAARGVVQQRAALMRDARPVLIGGEPVACVDVGWVGVVVPGRVVDLAGVTDPTVAYLPGGHTSKKLPADFLARRRVRTVLLLARDGSELPERTVELVALEQLKSLGFRRVAVLPLRGGGRRYFVYRLED